ncbi:MAG: hypothetical protein Q8N88_01810 [Nanoarchaeota archaeon]|nr:hypothetical protein [Nanoarchaeota archaeon]
MGWSLENVRVIGMLYRTSRENLPDSYDWRMCLQTSELDEEDAAEVKRYDGLTLAEGHEILGVVIEHNVYKRTSESELLEKIKRVTGRKNN